MIFVLASWAVITIPLLIIELLFDKIIVPWLENLGQEIINAHNAEIAKNQEQSPPNKK